MVRLPWKIECLGAVGSIGMTKLVGEFSLASDLTWTTPGDCDGLSMLHGERCLLASSCVASFPTSEVVDLPAYGLTSDGT